jgi:hypothetical protein
MRCFGSTNEYPVGVMFALPSAFANDESEDASAKRTRTWSWPSGYSAKTEFNIDRNGNLINGREEALVPLSGLRKMNHSYLHDTDYRKCGCFHIFPGQYSLALTKSTLSQSQLSAVEWYMAVLIQFHTMKCTFGKSHYVDSDHHTGIEQFLTIAVRAFSSFSLVLVEWGGFQGVSM